MKNNPESQHFPPLSSLRRLGATLLIAAAACEQGIDPGKAMPAGKRKHGPSNPLAETQLCSLGSAAHVRASWDFTGGLLQEPAPGGGKGLLGLGARAWGGGFTPAEIKIKKVFPSPAWAPIRDEGSCTPCSRI
ncbi:hypothetical protein DV515_00012631 [Chloebia gouldiae]|uniref:Uncharacterized protein n=1 Tax=Chloebia gouldiae TaxID=44316 RepID=A0A3L8S387_CHLGU|nr:hypothetical protein DV515_00012631 [Chloebia gouldiae]